MSYSFLSCLSQLVGHLHLHPSLVGTTARRRAWSMQACSYSRLLLRLLASLAPSSLSLAFLFFLRLWRMRINGRRPNAEMREALTPPSSRPSPDYREASGADRLSSRESISRLKPVKHAFCQDFKKPPLNRHAARWKTGGREGHSG